MRNITLTFLFILIAGSFIHAQKPACEDWKKGKFYMIAPDQTRIEIVRKGNKQVEHHVKTNSISTLRVKWIGPCTYTLAD